MKLYVDRMAPNARRVLMFIAEKKLELSVVEINIADGQHRTAEFLARNPLGQIPVLELPSGVCVSESMAICRFLDERFPQPTLFGRGPVERAVVHMWTRRMENTLFVPAVELGHHSHEYFREKFDQIPAYAELSRASIEKAYALLESQLRTVTFVAGDSFSAADILAFCGLELARLWDAPPAPAFKSLYRWRNEISQRQSAAIARYL